MKPVFTDFDLCKTRADIRFEMYLGVKNTKVISFFRVHAISSFFILHLVQSACVFLVHMCVNVNSMDKIAKFILGIILPSSE